MMKMDFTKRIGKMRNVGSQLKYKRNFNVIGVTEALEIKASDIELKQLPKKTGSIHTWLYKQISGQLFHILL